ncbi:uncharacterized protein LOC120682879 [Panicum virgatum]|uniref:Uncharacterized protein n=1 Tax=Panicum virgatum TaxID=38727 RepID=A0A8T0Q6T3_PANVG|nr:uncharacterized protein LOC120682879 [Panicum virgatum]KAG2568332.1 hypothetical protein PVAP13_7NG310000 [Panicum virgatum]
MLASTAASLRPPLRRLRGGGALPFGAHRGGMCAADPLFPRPMRRALACRADLQQDAPFAAAIGACVLASLVLPPPRPRGEAGEEAEEGGEFGATDTRMAVMGIISFLPYFNWLSWIFAWLDSGRRRYLVYAAVYLAPYLRTNLSLSPDESWLPIASIFICILHIQLEAGIMSGDIESFTFVERAWKLIFPSPAKKKDDHHGNKKDSIGMGARHDRRIPSAHESRERLRNSDIFKRKLDEPNEEKQK